MNDKELKLLQEQIKKEYDEAELDYRTFDGDIDMTLTYLENKNNVMLRLAEVLPKKIPKLKRDTTMENEQEKELQEKQAREQQAQQEAELKAREEAEAERIKNIPNGKEEEKIFFDMDGIIQETITSPRVRGCLISGASSLGKTFRVKKCMIKNKIPYVLHSGHITEMKFYIKCYQNSDKIHIFDDENILRSKTFLNMIKAMLNGETGIVEYDTSRKLPSDIKSSFEFTGKVIIILNDLPKNNEHFKAVKNRVLNYEIVLDRQQRLNLLYERAKNENIEEISKEERIKLVDWLRDNTDNGTLNLNYRLYEKAVDFYIHQKNDWERLTQTQIEGIDKYTQLIIDGLDTEEEWCNVTGKHRATFFRHKKIAKKYEDSVYTPNTNATLRQPCDKVTATIKGGKVA